MDTIRGGETNNVIDGNSRQGVERKEDKAIGIGKGSVHHNTRRKYSIGKRMNDRTTATKFPWSKNYQADSPQD